MKIIVSHDVDHLFFSDHLTDLVYPKLWMRESLRLFSRKISFSDWLGRIMTTVSPIRHRIEELSAFDKSHNVPSTFFFGMTKGLGMSYKAERAVPIIKDLKENGFSVGVHGIDFSTVDGIKNEKERFASLCGFEPDGIRMHYVRFNETTFELLAKVGYSFDSTEFDKHEGICIKAPFRVGKMWEFPLTIMDAYLPYQFEDAKNKTIELLNQAEKFELPYVSILFHDFMYSLAYSQTKRWYEWMVEYCEEKGYMFISYKDAMVELSEKYDA